MRRSLHPAARAPSVVRALEQSQLVRVRARGRGVGTGGIRGYGCEYESEGSVMEFGFYDCVSDHKTPHDKAGRLAT